MCKLRIFLSYPSASKTTAEKIKLALADRHKVFFAGTDIPPGRAYDTRIRKRILASDLFVFLITPDSVQAGSYTRSELDLAEKKWPVPKGRVLPVMIEKTPIEDVPPYLSSVDIMEPVGNPAADVAAHVAQNSRRLCWRRLWWKALAFAICGLLLVGASAALLRWSPWARPSPEITVTNVTRGAHVERNLIVRGTAKHIPKNQEVWMVIYSHPVERHYPQDSPVEVQADGLWSSDCHIGVEDDAGKPFDLIVVLADLEAQEALSSYLKESARKESWDGLPALPSGTVIYQRITVTRK